MDALGSREVARSRADAVPVYVAPGAFSLAPRLDRARPPARHRAAGGGGAARAAAPGRRSDPAAVPRSPDCRGADGVSPRADGGGGWGALARSGRGVALQVSGVRLLANDGTPVLSLPALAVRPSLGALAARTARDRAGRRRGRRCSRSRAGPTARGGSERRRGGGRGGARPRRHLRPGRAASSAICRASVSTRTRVARRRSARRRPARAQRRRAGARVRCRRARADRERGAAPRERGAAGARRAAAADPRRR